MKKTFTDIGELKKSSIKETFKAFSSDENGLSYSSIKEF